MKLYFITQSNKFGDSMILSPRIPKSIDEENGEDSERPRICVCKTVSDCMKSIQTNLFDGCNINIYSCDVPETDIYIPTPEEVPDVNETNEVWLQKDTKFILEEQVKISQIKNTSWFDQCDEKKK